MPSILDGLNFGGGGAGGLLDGLPPWLRETISGIQGSMPPNGIPTAGYGQFPQGGQPPQRQPQQPQGVPMPPMRPPEMAQQPAPPQQAPHPAPGGLPARTPFGQAPKVDGMGDRLYEALGGFLGNEGPVGGAAAGIKTLATGEVTNPYALQKRQQMETYAALQRDFGLTEPQARMAMQNPEVMKAFVPRIAPKYQFRDTGEQVGGFDPATAGFKPIGPSGKRSGFHIVGYDEMGKAKYGWVGSKPGEITPYDASGSRGYDATFQDPNNPDVGQFAQGLVGNDYVDALAKVSPGRAALLKKIGSGEIPFPSGRYLQSPAGMQLMEDLARFEPGSDATHFASRFNTRKDFTSGKSAQNLTSFNTVISHLDTLHNTIDGLKNSSSPIYNKAANWLATNTGDTKYQENFKKFDTARQAVTAELTRAFRGTGGNVADIKDWNAKLDAADSPESLKAAVNSAIELLKGRVDAVGDQYNRGMKSSKEPIELLSPKAQEAIKRLETKTGGDTSAAPASPKRVRQNGHVYEQQPDGSYKPVQ